MNNDKATGERIKKARINAGYTQQNIADILGVSIRTYQRMEKGTHEITPDQLQTLDKLIELSSEPYVPDDVSEDELNSLLNTNDVILPYPDLLKKYRLKVKLNQAQVADLVDVSLKTYKQYESGEIIPSYKRKKQLGQLLKMPESIYAPKTEREKQEELLTVLNDVKALFAGGSFSADDRDALMRHISEAYWEEKGKK